jgi:hypothetical protein
MGTKLKTDDAGNWESERERLRSTAVHLVFRNAVRLVGKESEEIKVGGTDPERLAT